MPMLEAKLEMLGIIVTTAMNMEAVKVGNEVIENITDLHCGMFVYVTYLRVNLIGRKVYKTV
jgi:hypothetical protein